VTPRSLADVYWHFRATCSTIIRADDDDDNNDSMFL